ncbi:MAG: hypothetical protein PHW63_08965 [Alphaproteobacteria bacterium]|nr:hypothetical protein [Alphaproteobacteria bacterium]
MSVAEARSAIRAIRPTDAHITLKRADAERAARTVEVQSEQIERLQRALSLNVVRGGTNALTRFEYMYQRGELLPDDMEPPA